MIIRKINLFGHRSVVRIVKARRRAVDMGGRDGQRRLAPLPVT